MKIPVIPQNEAARLAALEQLQILDSDAEEDFNDIVKLASQICETPISLVTLIDRDRQWFKAKIGLTVSETSRETAFCAHNLEQPNMLIVPDARKDERFHDNPLVTGDPNVVFYAGMPLVTEGGYHLGSLCVIDHQPRTLNETQVLTLKTLSRQVIKLLDLRIKIIKLQQSESSLQDIQNRNNILFNHSIDGLLLMDETGTVLQWNPMAIKIFGFSPEEIIGHKFYDKIIPENTRQSHIERINHFVLTGENPILNKLIEIKAIRKDGQEIDITYGVSAIMINGKKSVLGFMADITERKTATDKLDKQKEFYESILNSIPTDIAVFDARHRYLFVNPGAIKDAALRKYIIGKDDFEYSAYRNKDKSSAEARRAMFNQVVSTRTIAQIEDTIVNQEGKLVTHLRRMVPVYDKWNQLTMVIGYGIDITDRKHVEDELIKAKNFAEQLMGSKDQFLANMSHEIRTPMNAILGMANQLAKTELNDKQKFYNDTITKAAENLLIIINDILDFSKIEAGKLSLENIGFKPKEEIEKALQVMMYKAEEKGIGLNATIHDKKLAEVLIGDPYRINQVILNLLSNAIKFTEKGGVTLSCELLEDRPHTQLMKIIVTDTGIGMDQAYVDKIFEKFTQEDVTITRSYGGTGLGLSISKELVSLMGGEIKVASKKNTGTSIYFTIELTKGTLSDLASSNNDQIDTQILTGKKILVVDDNEMNRVVATTILNNHGAETTEAINGKESIEYLEKNKPDLVLMDIQMPVMDGVEATAWIRENISESLPVIALTANAIKGSHEKYISVGMNDYLSKPFTENDLITICAKWLDKEIIPAGQTNTAPENHGGLLFDLSYLNEISRGDTAFMQKMVDLFIEQIPASIAEINDAYKNADLVKVKALAHRTKSSIDTLCISSLQSVIKEIEMMAMQHQSGEKMDLLIQEMNNIYPKVIEQLKKMI
ncbi:MAG: hypothetical protein RLZZ28_293 [Bacteroidota bacterium]